MNRMTRILIAPLISLFSFSCLWAEQGWQQRVEYQMHIDFEVRTHRFTGTQTLIYFNRSPDTLTQVFYHLYFNAFQPGSAMSVWNDHAVDPDMRLEYIKRLTPEEQGYIHVRTLVQNGLPVQYFENGTILEVELAQPVLPGDTVRFDMQFHAQVPKLIRRSGRESAEGIAYSMSQWYPKICAYDGDGWHPNPYLGREFYGDFGDFDVHISMDKTYCIAAGGTLQNAQEIGYGYEDLGFIVPESDLDKLTWHFIARNVHDFVWAADPDYAHTIIRRTDGIDLHFFYQKTSQTADAWSEFPPIMDKAMDFVNARFGKYPYPSFSFIQGGDGGMEYPMATLITGNRSLYSLIGVAVHELMHSWYYGVLATNESRYAWMDEGFANYTETITLKELDRIGLLPGGAGTRHYFENAYTSYLQLVRLGIEEPMSTHADHFLTNTAYQVSAYAKGSLFLQQLEYIIGSTAMERTMLRYYNTWQFRHPGPLDFIRIAEKESGMILDWYYEYWILSTKTIDYRVDEVQADGRNTLVTIRRKGAMPMPIEILAKTRLGNTFTFYIPLDLMRGSKKSISDDWTTLEDWQWASPTYTFSIPVKYGQLVSLEIDPDDRMADIERADNFLVPQTE